MRLALMRIAGGSMGAFWMLLFVVLLVLLVVILALGVVVIFRFRATANTDSVKAEQAQSPKPHDEALSPSIEEAQTTTDREKALDRRAADLDEREARLEVEHDRLRKLTEQLNTRDDQLRTRAADVDSARNVASAELSRVAGLSADDARRELFEQVERTSQRMATARAQEIKQRATRQADQVARNIILSTIQRVSVDQTAQAVVSTVDLPNDEMKGRVIGREGRNIRAFEQTTGVDVLIDDTPGSVLLSCFDPVRREIARLTMQELITDGRIHPARISQAYSRAAGRVHDQCQEAAEQAISELGLLNVDPGLYEYIGALRYRTSYGQTVLTHMLECGRIAGAIAAELGLVPDSFKRAAFLHDLGKAVVTQGDGSHAAEGAELARRFGESEAVVNAIAAHHDEIDADSAEAVITQIADSISGSRPGARRESMAAYVDRLTRLEQLASAHPGVDKVFAMQAGREVRVMVVPEQIDDAASQVLATQIAREIEEELTYPGNIRISVVRESVATDVAH